MNLGDVVVAHECGHVEETVLRRAVAIHEVVTQAHLQGWKQEITYLSVGTPVVELAVNLLSTGEPDVHPIGLSTHIPTIVKHRELSPKTGIIGALAFALHIQTATHAKLHVATLEHAAVTLCHRHRAPRHEGQSTCIQE